MPGNISEPREAPRRPARNKVLNSGFIHNASVVNSKHHKSMSKKSIDAHVKEESIKAVANAKTGRPLKPNVGSMDRLRRLKAGAMK